MLLKKGDKGANVKAFQAFLNTQGEVLDADGNFGGLTEGAVRRFQAKHGLTSDGKAGQNTISVAMQLGLEGFGGDAKPSSGKLVLLSAGHTNVSGQDRGVGANGMVEGVEAVKIRDRVADLVRVKGVSVIEDGADGQNLPLSKALELAKKADIKIEWHFNAAANPSASGIEVLSMPAHTKFGQRLAEAVNQALSLPLRGDKGWKSDTSGQHSRLAFCRAGGLLIETCFLTNPGDVKSYQDNFEKDVRHSG